MKMKSLVIAAALLGGLFSASSFANVIVPLDVAFPAKFEAPVPTRVVSPTGLPLSHKGATVMLKLTIDAAGLPHDIAVVSAKDRFLTKSLVSAVSQWQFTPGRKNGTPVSTNVMLPLKLEDAGS